MLFLGRQACFAPGAENDQIYQNFTKFLHFHQILLNFTNQELGTKIRNDVGARGGVTPRKLSGTGSVKERERDFAEPGSAGPPPPPRAPAAGAEFFVRGCALPRRPRPVRNVHSFSDDSYAF